MLTRIIWSLIKIANIPSLHLYFQKLILFACLFFFTDAEEADLVPQLINKSVSPLCASLLV